MRLNGSCVGVDKGLEYVVCVKLEGAGADPLITLPQYVLDLAGFLAGQFQVQHIILDPLAPELIQRFTVGRPVILAPVIAVGFIPIKPEPLTAKDLQRARDALVNPLAVAPEHDKGRRQFRVKDGVIDPEAVSFKLVQVTLDKIGPVAIQIVQIMPVYRA